MAIVHGPRHCATGAGEWTTVRAAAAGTRHRKWTDVRSGGGRSRWLMTGAAFAGTRGPGRPGYTAMLCLLAQLPQLAGMALGASGLLMVPLSPVAGAGLGGFAVLWLSTLQASTPKDKLGRVMSADSWPTPHSRPSTPPSPGGSSPSRVPLHSPPSPPRFSCSPSSLSRPFQESRIWVAQRRPTRGTMPPSATDRPWQSATHSVPPHQDERCCVHFCRIIRRFFQDLSRSSQKYHPKPLYRIKRNTPEDRRDYDPIFPLVRRAGAQIEEDLGWAPKGTTKDAKSILKDKPLPNGEHINL